MECEFQSVDSSCRSEKCYINCIEKFNALISEGPTLIYVACNQCLYKSNVKRAKKNDYSDTFLLLNTGVVSFDKRCYICLTCHKSLKKHLAMSSSCQQFVFRRNSKRYINIKYLRKKTHLSTVIV